MARKPKKDESSEINAAEESVEVTEVDSGTDSADLSSKQDSNIGACGTVLNTARQAQGLTIQEVAKQLRLGINQVTALEEDDFSKLPEATIVKGFIRNYAKLLKIPSEPLVAAYIEMRPDKEQHAFALNPGINMKISEHKKTDKVRYFVFTVLLLLGFAVWFFYQNFVQKPNPVNPIPEIVDALPELALPSSERDEDGMAMPLEMPEPIDAQASNESSVAYENTNTDAEADVAQSETVESNTENSSETSEVETEKLAAEEAASQEEVKAVDQEAVQASSEPLPGTTRLEFSATQETWLSVVNTSGKEVYNKILYAGNRDVIDVSQPSEVVVGNAHGATLVVNGKTIDLAPYTRINVARVRLDQ